MPIDSERIPSGRAATKMASDLPVVSEAWIMGNGEIVEKSAVQRSKVTNQGKAESSKQITDDGFDYVADDLIKPPYTPNILTQLLAVNTEHYRCVQAKAADVVGRGFDIVERESLVPGEAKPNKSDREKILEMLSDCNDEMTFGQILMNMWVDFESIGDGYLEIGRNATGDPSKIWHIPGPSVRIRRNSQGYVQLRGDKKVFFQNFGEKFERGEDNSAQGDWHLMDPKTGNVMQTGTFVDGTNELLHFRLYNPQSIWYGIPDFIPATMAITGNRLAAEYNMQFFEHNAIPQYVVVIKGATISSGLRKMIADFFDTEIKGRAHKTFIMSVPSKNIEVEFKPLATEVREGSWEGYRKDNRDEVMRAHGVHPARIGIIETGQLGSGSGLSQQENYKNNIVVPRQEMLEHIVTHSLILVGFGVSGWQFKLNDLDIADKAAENEIAITNQKAGIVSINWVRTKILGEKPITGGDRPFVMGPQGPLFVDEFVSGNTANVPPEQQAVAKALLDKHIGDVKLLEAALVAYNEAHPEFFEAAS